MKSNVTWTDFVSVRGGPAVRRGLRAGVVIGLSLLLAVPALAARTDVPVRLEALASDVDAIVEASENIERNVAPGRGFITHDQAIQRYRDYVYLHLIGEHEQAAEGFYTLVTTVALDDAGLHWDAEWYLAESLYKMGNLRTAESNYQVIVNDGTHPFRDDAVRRLLEIYVDMDDDDAFTRIYEAEIVSGKVRPSELITYSVGKAFFRKGNYVEAKSNLGDIAPESAYYRKARYILGAIMVLEGNLKTAAQFYRQIVDLSVETLDDRKVLDLSLLALGRIYLELGLYEEASSFYGRISSDSVYLADKLYEEVWTFIKQKEEIRRLRTENSEGLTATDLKELEKREHALVQQSLRGIDIFLLAYPEHEYTGRLQLLQGHLHIQAVEYDSAMKAYEKVVSEYSPVRERFGELARSSDKPKEYFQQILKLGDRFQGSRDQIPAFAMALVMADQDLSRALTVYRDLEHQRQNISDSERIIAELTEVLGNTEGIGGFESIRYDVQLQRSLGVQSRVELLTLEEDWLEGHVTGDKKRAVEAIRLQREQVASTAMQAAAEGDIGSVRDKLAKLADQLKLLRGHVRDSAAQGLFAKFDALHRSLDQSETKLDKAAGDVGPLEKQELVRIKARFEHEVVEVERQRLELNETLAEAERVSVELTRSGFSRLEDFFAESVLRADVGIVDVYWAQKVEVSEEKIRVIEERNDLRRQVQQRFEIIEQKLRL